MAINKIKSFIKFNSFCCITIGQCIYYIYALLKSVVLLKKIE